MWLLKALLSPILKSSFNSLLTSGLLHIVWPAKALTRVFLGCMVTRGDQQPAADKTYFFPDKIFPGASRFDIFFLAAWHSTTSMNYMRRTRTVLYFPVTLTALLGCMICIQSLLDPPLMTIVPSYSAPETSKDMSAFFLSLPLFSAILIQLSTISCYILWCRSNSI